MSRARLATLLGYFHSQRQEIHQILSRVREGTTSTEPETVYLGYQMHNLYSALEDLFKQVAACFENQVDDLARFHRDLLQKMSFDVPGVRPRLLHKESYRLLDELRRFRHVFRHAYTYQLDRERVSDLRHRILDGWEQVESDLDEFGSFLRSFDPK